MHYSQDQRRKELKLKKYRDICKSFGRKVVEGRTVQAGEAGLSHYNHKTLDFTEFQRYCGSKNLHNKRLEHVFNLPLLRKLRLGAYMLKQKSEAKMTNKFKKTFGAPTKTIVCIGDWCQAHQCRWKEPTKGKGFCQLFKKAGYKVFLVNEF